METMLLRDPEKSPSDEVIKDALKDSYQTYKELTGIIMEKSIGLVPQWNYYRDGKAWLCKVCFKKKTVFWLSVWDSFFKISFYFTEKHIPAISELNISDDIKKTFCATKPTGKLIPLVLIISSKEQIPEALEIIKFKKSLK